MKNIGVQLAGGAGPDVDYVFLCMPWATPQRPSIAVGILEGLCAEAGASAIGLYPNLDLAGMIGDASQTMADEASMHGVGEHLFAADLFGSELLDSDRFLSEICASGIPSPYCDLAWTKRLRDVVIPRFLDDICDRVLSMNPSVVGLTATFNQAMASLSLAKRLKSARPDLVILVGGASFDGEMGIEHHRALPEIIDHVFMGEAEESFREFIKRRAAGEPTDTIHGTTWQDASGVIRSLPGRALRDMSNAPAPLYDSYFTERARVHQHSGFLANVEALPFESSRGCWWGQKNHCVFCGINKEILGFREKTVDRVLSEIVDLSRAHRVQRFIATDWIISRVSRAELSERLRDLGLDLRFFYETRSDLPKREVLLLRDAGIDQIQPGIESFSTDVLKLIKKGNTGIRQVKFLRWCREYGVNASYNILYGFPGDDPSWYLTMAGVLTQITHLQPPTSTARRVELHRYSPLFDRRSEFGINSLRPRADYLSNYPEGLVDPVKAGYFFDFDCDAIADPAAYLRALDGALAPWVDAWTKGSVPRFEYTLGVDHAVVVDTRRGWERSFTLDHLSRDVLLLCDDVTTLSRLRADLAHVHPDACLDGSLDRTVDDMLTAGILMREDSALLSLPIAVSPRTTEEIRGMVIGEIVTDPTAVMQVAA